MKTIQVLLVDDEPLAQEILESYILKIPGFELIAKCKNALEAFGVLSKNRVDIILLDINMPEINGIDFLKTIKNPPYIIFTTAYSEYAVESYEYNAVDYLLKPISFERFLKAINKALEVINITNKESVESATDSSLTQTAASNNIIFVKSDGKMIKVALAKLWFVEGLKDYIKLWTEDGKIIVHSTMKNFEDQLSKSPDFIRIQKSYIVNINYISEIDGNMVRIKDQAITIGTTYRDEIHKLFDKYKFL